jgi:hypothetical protein
MWAGDVMPPVAFKGTGLREYGRAASRLLDIAAQLESGQRRAEGNVNGVWTDVSLSQADELRKCADDLVEVLGKLMAFSAG